MTNAATSTSASTATTHLDEYERGSRLTGSDADAMDSSPQASEHGRNEPRRHPMPAESPQDLHQGNALRCEVCDELLCHRGRARRTGVCFGCRVAGARFVRLWIADLRARGLEYSAIAELVGLRIDAVRSRLSELRRALRGA